MSLKVLILGINGFIGNAIAGALLQNRDWEVYGIDIRSNNLTEYLSHPRFNFFEGDILTNNHWIECHVKKCDVVLPLVAIATPSTYVKNPLKVFELDFEANLRIIRQCVHYKKRVIFPSTSEVYGMCEEKEFNEETSNFVLGPILKERWIYSCSKQLLDRIIYAYGKHQELEFTIFRPFNWIGPKQDNVFDLQEGSSRVLPQFISNIIHGKDIQLVNGGLQRRSFTYLDDGIACLFKIIENKDGCAQGRIFNIGNPFNDFSIKELAETLVNMAKRYPKFAEQAHKIQIHTTSSDDYYGTNYQDVSVRIPSIRNAQHHLKWQPKINLSTALEKTLDYYACFAI